VNDGFVAAAQCHRVRPPRQDRAEVWNPTVGQVTARANAVRLRSAGFDLLRAGSGLRIRDPLGLSISGLDFARRTVEAESQDAR